MDCVIGSFGGDQDYVDVFGSVDVVEVDVEVVCECECFVCCEVWCDGFVVDGVLVLVWCEDYDDVGLFGGFGDGFDWEVGFFGFGG